MFVSSGSIAAKTGELSHPGVANFSTGTTATGRAGQRGYPAAIRFSGGAWVYEAAIRLTTLSDATNTYSSWAGFGDQISAEPVDGAYFRYTHSVNSGEFECVTSSNSTRTAVDTGVTVAAGTWYRLRIEVNAAGTSVQCYVDGTAATGGANTTNIPTAAGRETSTMPFAVLKSVGTTARTFNIDYVKYVAELTTAR